MELNSDQKRQIVEIAKEAISLYVKEKRKLDLDYVSKRIPELFYMKEGVFVTIYKLKELRGCIGFTYPVEAFGNALIDSAILSASEDPRFDPLQPEELKDLKVEVSVLEKPVIVNKDNIEKEIKIGEDGLIVSSQLASGLLLPQVAIEEQFDALSFVEATCLKAGLSKNAWKEKETKLFKFRACYFS
ncbi:MAG: AmmeMemoRadiSam system protein A [Candidatus Acidifodinimicrobium sp.]